jgi:hypothetical protein
MTRWLVALSLLAACASGRGGDDAVTITAAHGSPGELAKAAQIRRLIEQYDLSKWTFTRSVLVDEKAPISHSHPVLTLDVDDKSYPDDVELAAYVHEQIHWLETDHPQETETAMAELRTMYPDAPSRGPEGARDLESTYLHLIVCHLEYEAMKELVGTERANAAMQKPYYRWVYRTVLADNERIKDVVRLAGLVVATR